RKCIGCVILLAELAASMQPGEDQFDNGGAFLGVRAYGDAASSVPDTDAAVCMHRDIKALCVSGQCLVGRVIDDFLNNMQRVVSEGIHARPLPHMLQALEDLDRCFVVTWIQQICSQTEMQK